MRVHWLASSSLSLILIGTSACSSGTSSQDESAGFDAVVLTVQGAGSTDQRLRAFGLQADGAAEELCPNAGGIDVSLDRRHIACESSAPSHAVSVFTRGQGSKALGEFQSPVFAPDGERLALSGSDALFVANADGSQLGTLPGDAGLGSVLGAAQWSSTGRFVAVLTQNGALVWDVAARSLALRLPDYQALSWLPRSERLAATKPGTLLLVDGDGQHADERADAELTALWPGFSASGQWLAYPRAMDILLLNHVTGEEHSLEADIRTSWLDWSPSEDALVMDNVGASGPQLTFWSPSAELSVPRTDAAYGTVEWSPDGTLLRDYRNEGSLIYDGATGTLLASLDGRLQWSPSAQNLTTLSSDGRAQLADRVGGAPRLLTDFATRLSWFPDNQHLAVQIENELYVTGVDSAALRLVADLTQ